MTPIFAADWLNISINLLLVIHVIVCLLLALVVLMQRPKQEGLGAAFGGGLTDQAFGAQTTNVLQKGTVYLGTLFFVVTLVLAILIGKRQRTDPGMAEDNKAKTEEAAVPATTPEGLKGKEPVTMPEKTQRLLVRINRKPLLERKRKMQLILLTIKRMRLLNHLLGKSPKRRSPKLPQLVGTSNFDLWMNHPALELHQHRPRRTPRYGHVLMPCLKNPVNLNTGLLTLKG